MNVQTFLLNILKFLNEVIVPFLIAIAFLVFIWNIVRYFIIGGANEDDQKKAKSLAFWGISAFVVILSFWGIVNLFVYGLGFGNRAIIPDYMCQKLGGNCEGAAPINQFGVPSNAPYSPPVEGDTYNYDFDGAAMPE
jgi:hypothetical protein